MYEDLVMEAHANEIDIIEMNFKGSLKGLYSENTIAINSKIKTNNEKNCVLAEELGHHYTSFGDILNTKDIRSVKQEKIARNWGYEKLAGMILIIDAYKLGMKNRHEMAEHLNITEAFLEEAIDHYKEKYGIFHEIDNYIVYFEPFGILEIF